MHPAHQNSFWDLRSSYQSILKLNPELQADFRILSKQIWIFCITNETNSIELVTKLLALPHSSPSRVKVAFFTDENDEESFIDWQYRVPHRSYITFHLVHSSVEFKHLLDCFCFNETEDFMVDINNWLVSFKHRQFSVLDVDDHIQLLLEEEFGTMHRLIFFDEKALKGNSGNYYECIY